MLKDCCEDCDAEGILAIETGVRVWMLSAIRNPLPRLLFIPGAREDIEFGT